MEVHYKLRVCVELCVSECLHFLTYWHAANGSRSLHSRTAVLDEWLRRLLLQPATAERIGHRGQVNLDERQMNEWRGSLCFEFV